jgi:hypothetical protein
VVVTVTVGGGFDWAVLIAVLALVFSVASYWALNARRGRLQAFPPTAFAASLPTSGTAIIRLPLALYNDGAVPIVILDLQLRLLPQPDSNLRPLTWDRVRDRLRPEPEDGFRFASAFALDGRAAGTYFVEFQSDGRDPRVLPLEHSAELWVRRGDKPSWTRLLSFPLHLNMVPATNPNPGAFITYRNADPDLSKR